MYEFLKWAAALGLAIGLLACEPATRSIPAEPGSAAEFVELHPDRAASLLAAIDLERPDMAPVRQAFEAGDSAGALEALLEHYRSVDNGAWLQAEPYTHDPGGYEENIAEQASQVLGDVFTFQGVTGPVARLSNGAIDWFDSGPKDDYQWTLFLSRNFMLIPLIKAYASNSDPAIAARAGELVADWVVANAGIPEGDSDRDMPPTWQPMSSASRLLQVWPQAFYLLGRDRAFTPLAKLLMLSSVPEQANHLVRYHRRQHNHAIKEMNGLAHAAAAWPEFRDAGRWREYAQEVLLGELDWQVYPSGVQKELSFHYHRNVLNYLAMYVAFSRASGHPVARAFEEKVEAMSGYLVRAMRPDGHGLLNNDADRDDVRAMALDLAETFSSSEWSYIATHGERGTPPDGTPSDFWPWAGQLVSRSAYSPTADWSAFDAGPWGIAHQHDDKLHLSVAVGGFDALVDTGRWVYKAGDPHREYVLASAGHNVILVDGQGQNPGPLELEAPLEGVAALEPDFDFAWGETDAGFEDVAGHALHRRAVAYVHERFWLVADLIQTDRPRDIEPLWHFHPRLQVSAGPGDSAVGAGQGAISILPIGDVAWGLDVVQGQNEPVVQGWYSPFYNRLDPAPTAVYRASINDDSVFAWLIVPERSDPASLVVEQLPAPAGAIRFRIHRVGGESLEVAMRLDGSEPVPLEGGLLLDGWFTLVRGGTDPLLAGGRLLDRSGRVLAEHALR